MNTLNKFLITVPFVIMSFAGIAQSWQTLNASTLSWRFEDMQFIDTEIGWVVDGGGQILKTTDGGLNWTQQFYDSDYYFRSVEFFNEQIGFAGSLSNGNPSASLFKTTNGGDTWVDISASLPVNVPGICGMHMVDENTIFITGVFYGSGYIMKSTDQGETWTYTNMLSLCNGIVDVFFKDQNIGFAVGQSAQGTGLRAIIIGTTNGGDSWATLATGNDINQRAWKIQELNDNVLYASVEAFTTTPEYFKSTDGGQTWQLHSVTAAPVSGTIQGVGFLNEQVGWVGGFNTFFFETENQGANWEYQSNIGSSFNRFQRINDTLMYTSGVNVYKYVDPSLLSIEEFEIPKPKGHTITFLPSNVIDDHTEIKLDLVTNTYCELSVYNVNGQRLETIYEGRKNKGEHHFSWNSSYLASGQYYLVLNTYYGYQSSKFVVN
ncbi:WD40/YVTN/BNR-like repeat-containing protein [Psychroserpens sp. XS_ASV72]|uniref:WD40/YVTN/BNR-like repeat-containing protein n=1 Tax=Psychroserpens sp. XS_ASV72 TaxID=3241293 RepID=UPI003513A2C5